MDFALPSSLAAAAHWFAASTQAVATTLPQMTASVTPSSVTGVGATLSTSAAHDLPYLAKPVQGLASGLKVSHLDSAVKFLGKAMPIAVIGASAFEGAQMVEGGGPKALIDTKNGRSAVLGAIGGTMLLIPTGVTQIGAAAVLGASAANEFGAFDGLDAAS